MPWVLGMQYEQGRWSTFLHGIYRRQWARRQLNKEVTECDPCYKGTRKSLGRVIRRGEDCKSRPQG